MAAKTRKVSKNQRPGIGKKASAFEVSADAARVVCLARGAHAYVFGLDGKTAHVAVASPAMVDALRQFRGTNFEERVGAAVAENDAAWPGNGWAESWAATAETGDMPVAA